MHDLEKTSAFYCGAYGFIERARACRPRSTGEPIDEILLGLPDEQSVPLILMKYVDRSAPPIGEVALVFMTGDIEALFERSARAHGGEIRVAPYQSDVTPLRAGFTVDPEGHLIENIERPA